MYDGLYAVCTVCTGAQGLAKNGVRNHTATGKLVLRHSEQIRTTRGWRSESSDISLHPGATCGWHSGSSDISLHLGATCEHGPCNSALGAVNPKTQRATSRLEELIRKHLAVTPPAPNYFNVAPRGAPTDMIPQEAPEPPTLN